MVAGLIGAVARADGLVEGGMHRSRFSLRFNTPRTRRVLMVQLVSIPAEDKSTPAAKQLRVQAERPASFNSLVDDYITHQFLRRGY